MPQGTKKTRHVAELDPAKLNAHSYALRLAKQVAQEIERPRRSTTRKKNLRRNSA